MVIPKLFAVSVLLATCYLQAKATEIATDDCGVCEEQLSKYRKFILQAIINFEDVCDSYHPEDGHEFIRNYQPQERSEIWAFFKLLMAQFNDVDFVNVVHDAVLERCRTKSQRGEKRDGVVLGKKQRFHSWGGKRSPPQLLDLNSHILYEKPSPRPFFI